MFNNDHSWIAIARNEYRLSTSSIRGIRSYLPYILIGGLMLFIFVIAPNFVNIFIEDFHALILSQIAVGLIQFYLLFLSLIFFALPITSSIQDMKTGQLALILSAPVNPTDLLIGEFIGKIWIYATIAAIIGGIFTGALVPLGLDYMQVLIIILVFILNFLTASWCGNVSAAILRSILSKTARGRDIGKGIAVLIIMPPVLIMYAFIGGYFEALRNPEVAELVNNILGFFPFSWGAEVIVSFAINPGSILTIDADIIIQLWAMILFFGATLLIGIMLSNRIYSLEPSSFGSSKANPSSAFYRLIKSIGGGENFGIMLSASFKMFLRKVKNLTMMAYFIGLIIVMQLVFPMRDDPESVLVSSFILGPLLAALLASDITLQGKDNLLAYRHTPTSAFRLIMVKISQYFLILIPTIIVVSGFIHVISPGVVFSDYLLNVSLIILMSLGSTFLNCGVFLLNPVWDDQKNKGEYMINFQIAIFAIMIPFFICLIFLDNFLYYNFGIIDSFYYAIGVFGVILAFFGGMILFLGMKRLEGYE